jgi:hypothetical protein
MQGNVFASRPARKEVQGPGDRGRQKRQVCQVPMTMSASRPRLPRYTAQQAISIDEFDDEHGERGFVQARAQLRRCQARPQRDVMVVHQEIEDQMRRDSDANGPAERGASESFSITCHTASAATTGVATECDQGMYSR